MLANIREIQVISASSRLPLFQSLLGSGVRWGLDLKYAEQLSPDGLVQAFLIGENLLGDCGAALVFGDNLVYGHEFSAVLQRAARRSDGATLFAYRVADPERCGVVGWQFGNDGERRVVSHEEKPHTPASNCAVTGLYFYDHRVVELARRVTPASRGELEIMDLNRFYLNPGDPQVDLLGRGMTCLDTGTCDSLQKAGSYIRALEKRQALKIGCPEEVAWRQRWITDEQLMALATSSRRSGYRLYLEILLGEQR
jgi:glucose-1-phosphate thymidylyltransferase